MTQYVDPSREDYVDPLTSLYRAIRQYYVDDPHVAEAVRTRPDLTGDAQDPVLDRLSDGEVPELILQPTTGEFQVGKTNTGHRLRQDFAVRVTTGKRTLHDGGIFPVRWALFVAHARLVREQRRAPGSRGFLGLSFLQSVRLAQSDDAVERREQARGTRGWVNVLTLETWLAFDDDDLGIPSG